MKSEMFRPFLTFLISFLLLGSSFAQQKETRVALVIGNSTYKTSPLRNPVNDSRDMAAKLRALGFTVVERNNLVVKYLRFWQIDFYSPSCWIKLPFDFVNHFVQISVNQHLTIGAAHAKDWSFLWRA